MNTELQQKSFRPIWQPIAIEQQTWRALVKNRNLVIEIGPGVGLHPLRYAKQHPQDFIIAIEKTTEKFNKFAKRRINHPQLDNIYPVHANAIEWITRNISAGEVDAYFLLYPNPYPKAAQKNKRLMHMPFMQYLIKSMRQAATLTMATNMQFFYQEAKQQWSQVAEFALVTDRILSAANQVPRTHFERKYLASGQQCYELIFKKI